MNVKNESGQAIVLIALLMIAMLAVTGLAIDGGGMFLLQRDAQNAVDAGTWAATYALCSGGDIAEAAGNAVRANGFDPSNLTITTPITHRTDVANPEEYVRLELTAEKTAYFIQIVYRGPLIVTTSAVGHCNTFSEPPTISLAE